MTNDIDDRDPRADAARKVWETPVLSVLTADHAESNVDGAGADYGVYS